MSIYYQLPDESVESVARRGCLRRLLNQGKLSCNLTIGMQSQRFGEDDVQLGAMATCDACLAELELMQRRLDR